MLNFIHTFPSLSIIYFLHSIILFGKEMIVSIPIKPPCHHMSRTMGSLQG